MNDEALIEAIAARIQRYLCDQPNSADTVEGVHGWWLGGLERDASLDMTEAALALLARRGVVEAVSIGRRRVWRLARNNAAA